MSELNVQAVLAPVSDDQPCGTDLSYDPAYLELERMATGSPERQVGDSIIPAEEPNWQAVSERCIELLTRTKDLRVVMQLLLAELRLRGLRGLADGLAVLRGALEQFWDRLYPQLDPDDGNDPAVRINLISALSPPPGAFADVAQFKRRVREVPLTQSRQFGRFSLRDLAVAAGALPPADPDGPKLEPAQIEAAFADTPIDELKDLFAAAERAQADLAGLRAVLIEHAGVGAVPDFKDFASVVKETRDVLYQQLDKRGAIDHTSESGDGTDNPSGAGTAAGVSGEIRSTRDVVDALDRICDYYARYEPSSPIPLLLRRAQRLVSKNFMEIMKDLSPGALSQIEIISGTEGQSGS